MEPLQALPGGARSASLRAGCAVSLFRPNAAPCFKKSESFMPTPPLFSGQTLLRSGKIFLLAAALSTSAAHADDYADVNRLNSAGQFTQALAKAEAYLVTKPKDPQMLFLKGVAETQAGKPDEAIATFSQLTGEYPELPEPYNNLAALYAKQGQLDKARAALEMAIRINPAYAIAHENLGDVYARLANQSYSRALQLDTGNSALRPKLALIRQLLTPTKAP